MIKKRDVFLKVCEEHSRFVTCFVNTDWEKEVIMAAYKMSPEEVHLLVKAAKKYYDLVVL